MSNQYTSGANNFTGTHATHPDLPVSGTTAVDIAATYGVSDMAAVDASMLANSVHSVDLLKDSDMGCSENRCGKHFWWVFACILEGLSPSKALPELRLS